MTDTTITLTGSGGTVQVSTSTLSNAGVLSYSDFSSTISDKTTIAQCQLGSGITTIADNTFSGCTNLTSILLHSPGKSSTKGNNLTTLGANIFNGCTSLTQLTVPNSVQTTLTNANAFSGSSITTLFLGLDNQFGYLDGEEQPGSNYTKFGKDNITVYIIPTILSNGVYSVNENETVIGNVQAQDDPASRSYGDQSDGLTFSVTGTELQFANASINADASTGVGSNQLTFITAPNYEQKNVYTATVTVSDGTYSDTQNITVNVVNVNEAATGTVTIDGTTTQGQILTANTGGITDPDGLGTFTYQWKRGGSAVTGATNNQYTLAQADVGSVISVTVTYVQGTETKTFTASTGSTISNSNDSPGGTVTIDGTPTQGQKLTANTSTITDADGLGTFSYQWKRGGSAITDATNDEYTLVQADVGNDISVSVSYLDGGGTTETLTSASKNINNLNDSPTFTSTPVTSAIEDLSYLYTVTTQDVDAGDSVTLSGTTIPSWLTFTASDGKLSGTPTNDNVGIDNNDVVITATDQNSGSATQSFTITVTNVNDTPTFTSTPITTATEDVRYNYTATAQDVDTGDSITLLTGTTIPSWLTFNASTGLLTGIPENNDVGNSNNVVLKATSSDGSTVTQSFTITVANVNDTPTFTSTPVPTATEDVEYKYTATAEDVDAGDSVTLSGTTIPGWLTFTASTGVLKGTPTNDDVGNNNNNNVVLKATSSDGSSVTQSFTITVTNVNDSPTFTSTPIRSITEDEEYKYTATIQDVDAGDSVTLTGTTIPSWLTFNASNGLLSGIPRNKDVGNHTVSITALDQSSSVTQTFTITVTNVNDAPTFTSTPVPSAIEDLPYLYTVTTQDVDAGDSVTLTGTTIPSWLKFTPSTGLLSGTPTNDNVGIDNNDVVITATDQNSGSATQSFTITVTNVNDTPTFTSTPITTATEDVEYNYTAVAQDVDAGDSITLSGTTIPSWLTFNASTGVLKGTPTNDDVGNNNNNDVVLKATSSDGSSVTQSFTITVTNVNDAPTFTSTPIRSATEDVEYKYTATAQDVDAGDSVTLTGTTIPSWLTFNASTGLLTGIPRNDDVGNSNNVVLKATDNSGTSVTQSFTITVTNVNDSPTFTSTPDRTATEDEEYNYTAVAQDVDAGDSVTLSGTTIPSWLKFTASTGVLKGTPTNDDVGNDNNDVVITATDNSGISVTQSFTITVTNVNDAPTFTSTPITGVGENIEYNYTATAEDVDAGDSVTLSGTTIPGWLTFNASTGLLTGIPRNDDVGNNDVVLKATDNSGTSVTQSFTIRVGPFKPATKSELQNAINKWYTLANDPNDTNRQTTANNYVGSEYYGNPKTWIVSLITDLSYIFFKKHQDNHPDISIWDVSNVTSMQGTFSNSTFNGELINWNVSNVNDFSYCFANNIVFNQILNRWNIQDATTMKSMFANAFSFNQTIEPPMVQNKDGTLFPTQLTWAEDTINGYLTTIYGSATPQTNPTEFKGIYGMIVLLKNTYLNYNDSTDKYNTIKSSFSDVMGKLITNQQEILKYNYTYDEETWTKTNPSIYYTNTNGKSNDNLKESQDKLNQLRLNSIVDGMLLINEAYDIAKNQLGVTDYSNLISEMKKIYDDVYVNLPFYVAWYAPSLKTKESFLRNALTFHNGQVGTISTINEYITTTPHPIKTINDDYVSGNDLLDFVDTSIDTLFTHFSNYFRSLS